MMNYTLKNYEEQLRHQVVHMDQAVCYCPEFRATKLMHQYPSRRLQLARAIWLGEIELTDYSGEINFDSILSRQGERWQNFGECPEGCTDATILSREMLLKKGYKSPAAEAFKAQAAAGTVYPAVTWDLPVDAASKTAILLDGATAQVSDGKAFADYCKKTGLSFANEAQSVFVGFEYFAYGLVEEGVAHVSALVAKYNALNVDRVIVLSAQAAYMLTKFVAKLGIELNFAVVYLPEMLKAMPVSEETYVYAGSFNVRYLVNGEMLNALVPADSDVQRPNSEEFVPTLKSSTRINRLTIWQKPIGAEYQLYAGNEAMMKTIQADAMQDIAQADATQILVFEPTAYAALKDAFADKKVVYYLDYLK